jgi:arylformamidase
MRLTEQEIVLLSPMRLPPVDKPLVLAYGTTELPPLISDSRDLHALRSAAHLPGALIPVPGANHFTITNRLRDQDGIMTRHLPLLLPTG